MAVVFDSSKLTVQAAQWKTQWTQRTAEDKFEIWVGTETVSCMVGIADTYDDMQFMLRKIVAMREAVKLLKGER